MIIDTEALLAREEIGAALAANILSDLKGIVNSISLKLEGGSGNPSGRGSIAYELLQAFGDLHDAEMLIRKKFKLER
jgi:hypothetical protein